MLKLFLQAIHHILCMERAMRMCHEPQHGEQLQDKNDDNENNLLHMHGMIRNYFLFHPGCYTCKRGR